MVDFRLYTFICFSFLSTSSLHPHFWKIDTTYQSCESNFTSISISFHNVLVSFQFLLFSNFLYELSPQILLLILSKFKQFN